MKWKTVLVTAVIALLVVVLTFLSLKAFEPHKDIKNRISQYKLVLEEQELITKILTLKYEGAVIQAKFQPAPARPAPPPTRTVIESEKE